jgi:type VI secretion system secreted protein VgrG
MARGSDRRRPGARGYSDLHRIATLTTPLGPDALLLTHMSGREAISQLYRYDLDLVSEREDIDDQAILGKPVCLTVRLEGQKEREFTGFVSRFTQASADTRFVYYKAEVVPWLWFLTRNADSRVFQDQTVPDIVRTIFLDRRMFDFQMHLSEPYSPWEYCVQYRETDFNFVSRLLEQEGIYYYWKHENGRHTMMIVDGPSGTPLCPGQIDADYASGEAERRSGEVYDWTVERGVPTGRYVFGDYNFKTPRLDLVTQTQTIEPIGGNMAYEIFDYPGEYEDRGQGETAVKLRMQAEETAATHVSARSELVSFLPGFRFSLRNHYRRTLNTDYLLTEVAHRVSQGIYGAGDTSYDNSFSCLPSSIDYRPEQRTPKPLVHGVQTARVVGPAGEEIHVDKYGRVRVHFFWDREHQGEPEDSSCWVRVSQSWAGPKWGAHFHPRIGQEVIVQFEEGDPDRPLVIGRLHNADEMPPYELPRHKTRSGIKTRSTKSGSSSNFNEIRFEDKRGSEQLFLHAEREKDEYVKSDSREWVGHDRHLLVKEKQKEKVEGDKHLIVGSNHAEKIGGAKSLTVGGNHDEKIGQKWAAEAGQEIHLKAGMKVVIEAGVQLTIKAAGGFIDIGPAGISIVGTLVNINSGGSPGAGSGAQPASPQEPDLADDGTKGTKR